MTRKAFLMAAGLGTRLGSLTADKPKCLLPVAGEPILHWWLASFERLGVSEVLLNTHHFADAVEGFARSRRYRLTVRVEREGTLLGSAGTVAAHRAFVADEGSFWIGYADTLIGDDLARLAAFHRERSAAATIGLFRPEDPRSAGVVEVGPDGRALSFEEKPSSPRSALAFAGVMLAGAPLLRALEGRTPPLDLGRDAIPRLVGEGLFGLELADVLDIGTPTAYEKAQREWRARDGRPVHV